MQTFHLKVIGEIVLRHLPQLINKEGTPPHPLFFPHLF